MCRVNEFVRVGQGVRKTARHIVLSVFGTLLPRPQGPFLRPLFFHRVRGDQVKNFKQILDRLRHIGQFASTDTCLSMLHGRIPIDGRYFHLSFDDGDRDFVRNAAPILRCLEIPALMFVSTAQVGVDRDVMAWDDLKTLHGWGFEVGSHTRTHTLLTEVSKKGQLEEEIAGSKRDIEERLGAACKYIAWPYGRKSDIDDLSIETISRAGYLACFGGFRGSVHPGRTSPFRIPRHHLGADWPWMHVRYFAYGHGED